MSGPTPEEVVSGIRIGRVATTIEERFGLDRGLCEGIATVLDECEMLRKLSPAAPSSPATGVIAVGLAAQAINLRNMAKDLDVAADLLVTGAAT